MDYLDKKQLMVDTFKTQFSGIPEELRELKAEKCLAFAVQLHLTLLSELSPSELKLIKISLNV